MPVWQEFYTQQQNSPIEILSAAIDFQGAEKARPFVEQTQATYPNVVDSENLLGLAFGFKAVPNGVFVDEAGIIRYTKFGGFDIRKPEDRRLIEAFVADSNLAELEQSVEATSGIESDTALAHMQQGVALYKEGNMPAALAEWRKGVALEPDNWIIRKQVCAMENPERFYAGDVDFDWQRTQIAQNR